MRLRAKAHVRRLSRGWFARITPLTAGVIALLLLAAGFVFAVQLEQIGRTERIQQSSVQAQTLASGIAAPLAFEDQAALQEYLNAMRADPQIVAVGAYDAMGNFVAGYAIPPARLPARGLPAGLSDSSRDLIVNTDVMQGGTRLGSVHIRRTLDSWPRRALRYVGIASIVVMASLLIALLGASYASLRKAHGRLQAETASRLKAEEALRQSQKMEALGQLTGGVAHDFNNLLMVASGSLELMERTRDPVKIERLKTGMRQAVDRGAKLTQQLLSFSRRSPLQSDVVDLADRISGMDALLDRLITSGVRLDIALAPDLWPIEVDPSELEVALLNIVINARDAMPQGGVIRLTAANRPGPAGTPEGEGDRVRIAIADEGTGIAPEALDRIFEPFFTTKGAGHGTGLGLSQVHGFARTSGGEVRVESQLGVGTAVALLIPRSLKTPVRPQAETAVIEANGKRRILLVEDNDTVAEMVSGMLDEIGYEQERAVSGDAALARLERNADFSLILSDMIMPGTLNGLDLVHEVARRWPGLPYVLMTGYSEASATARREGIPLLTKPFTLQKLSAQIDETVARP